LVFLSLLLEDEIMTNSIDASGNVAGMQALSSLSQQGAIDQTVSAQAAGTTDGAATFGGTIGGLQSQRPDLAKILQDFFAYAIFYQVKGSDERSQQRLKEQKANEG
jgi:hypothetical protein